MYETWQLQRLCSWWATTIQMSTTSYFFCKSCSYLHAICFSAISHINEWIKQTVHRAIQNCTPFLRRLRNVISMDVCIMASRVPDENSSSIVCTSEPFTAGRSTVGPNTVARFCRDILFSASFSATLQTAGAWCMWKYSYISTQWHSQLWGTGARAPPLGFQQFYF